MGSLKRWVAWGAAGLLMAAVHSIPSQAQEHRHGGRIEGREEHGRPRGERELPREREAPRERIEPHREFGELREFRGPDRDEWRRGHWIEEEHEGRRGWWWVVGGIWFPFAAPVYPYAPYPLDTYPPNAPVTYWYYCPSADAYYPDVPQCPEGWTVQVAEPGPYSP